MAEPGTPPAVQAIASIASVCVTLMLAFVTYRYVQLTQSLAEAANEQLRMQRHSAASEAAQLLTLVDLLSGSVKKCPASERDAEQIRSIPIWKQSELTRLATLAASVLGPRHADPQRHSEVELDSRQAGRSAGHRGGLELRLDEVPRSASGARELGDTRALLTQLRDDVEARSPIEAAV